MNKLKRFWRHLTTTRASGQRAFPRKVLDEIQKTIAQGETLHRAEVRMIIEPSLPLGDILDGMHQESIAGSLEAQVDPLDTRLPGCRDPIVQLLADGRPELNNNGAIRLARQSRGLCLGIGLHGANEE